MSVGRRSEWGNINPNSLCYESAWFYCLDSRWTKPACYILLISWSEAVENSLFPIGKAASIRNELQMYICSTALQILPFLETCINLCSFLFCCLWYFCWKKVISGRSSAVTSISWYVELNICKLNEQRWEELRSHTLHL